MLVAFLVKLVIDLWLDIHEKLIIILLFVYRLGHLLADASALKLLLLDGQLSFEALNLALELVDVLILFFDESCVACRSNHVLFHLGLQILCSVCVLQRIQGVLIVLTRWRDVSNHECFWVTCQRLLEDSGKLWVTERHVILLACARVFVEHVDTVSECEERPVNVCSLFHAKTCIPCSWCSLWASQVN